jgi:MIP family channel proteins
MDAALWRTALAEFLGTFLLVFAGPGAIVINEVSGGELTHLGIGLSFGLAVTAAIVAFGGVSGAHINPTVSLGFALNGRLSWSQLPAYIGPQLLGAVIAAALLLALFGNVAGLGATVPSGSDLQALVLEVVISFFLMTVILGAITDSGASLGSAALLIGGYVGLAAIFAGPIAGASMNPARSVGPSLVSGVWDGHWVYWLGPIGGALLATLAFQWLRPAEPAVRSNALKVRE